jgi:hypothetical protein
MELIYARWLAWGARAGLVLLVVAFLAYLCGWARPLIALQDLPRLWTLPLDRYLEASGAPTGWRWLALADRGDYANLVGVAVLGLVSLVCYLRLLGILITRGERALAAIAVLQIVVLAAAASGLFTGGG